MRVRNYLIENSKIPNEYDILLINRAYETAINIYGDIDYMIIHDSDPDLIKQVRGRLRNDLTRQYNHNKNLPIEEKVEVPLAYLDVPLFKEEKKALCELIQLKDREGRTLGWTTLKRNIINSGYKLKEKRIGTRNALFISM